MSIELPKDAEGREIPLETKVMYGYGGTARNIVYWVFTTVSNLEKEWWNCWRAVTDAGRKIEPGLMHLTPPDSWEKLLEDLGEAGDARYYEACAYFHRDKDEDGCTSCPGGEDGCARIAMRDIADRIRKLRSEDE